MINNLDQIEQHDYSPNLFIGVVVANDDPEQLERVKVQIPGLLVGETANLPWIAPFTKGSIANGTGHGSFGLVPRVGDELLVAFQDGDLLYGYYFGSPIRKGMRPAQANVNYPNRYGMIDPAGNSLIVDTTPGSNITTFTHASGTTIQVNNDGSINLTAVGNITSSAPAWTHTGPLDVVGDVAITGNLDLSGNETVGGNITAIGNIVANIISSISVVINGLSFFSHRHDVNLDDAITGEPRA